MPGKLKGLWLKVIDLPFLLGIVATVVFYAFVHQESMHGTLLHRYTTEHAIEYVVVVLFMWGLADIVLKSLAMPRELLALKYEWLPPRRGREPLANAPALLKLVQDRPQWQVQSKVGRRLTEALEYVIETESVAEYRDHLQYLADQEEDQTQSNYTLLRFVIGITPVIGLLGTVVHFGTALSGISFDELMSRLAFVVGEIGQAFNTTTVALGTSMSMMFLLFLVERVDTRILRSVHRLAERELANRFEVTEVELTPLVASVKAESERTLQCVVGTLTQQVALWTQALEQLFQRFDARDHRDHERWASLVAALQQRHEAYDAQRAKDFERLIGEIGTRQQQVAAHITHTLNDAKAVRHDVGELVRALCETGEQEERLVSLQSSLAENLRLLRETQQMEDALHGLTAAIHLITARHQPTIKESRAA